MHLFGHLPIVVQDKHTGQKASLYCGGISVTVVVATAVINIVVGVHIDAVVVCAALCTLCTWSYDISRQMPSPHGLVE